MNTPKKLTLSLTLFFFLLLVACTSATVPTSTTLPVSAQATQTSEPTHTNTPLPLTPTPKPVQLTAAAQLTQVANSQVTATEQALNETENIPSPPPTPDLSLIGPALETIRQPGEIWMETSPDGLWIAQGINQICAEIDGLSYTYYQIKLTQTNNLDEWVVYEQLWTDCGLGAPHYGPASWSPDGHYFYYAEGFVPDGCPAFFGGNNLYQVDLTSQGVTRFDNVAQFALSPDQSNLAILSGNEVVLWSLSDGETGRTTLQTKGVALCCVLWSPDGMTLMVGVIVEEDCGTVKNSSIIRIDLPNLEQTVLVEADGQTLLPFEWNDPEQILLIQDSDYTYWLLNPQTGELTSSK